jgi:hypothetical protein
MTSRKAELRCLLCLSRVALDPFDGAECNGETETLADGVEWWTMFRNIPICQQYYFATNLLVDNRYTYASPIFGRDILLKELEDKLSRP